jgi:hypothetical protein
MTRQSPEKPKDNTMMNDILRHIISSLDPQGDGFRTTDAAQQLFQFACEGRNDLPPLLLRLARRGAREGVAAFHHTSGDMRAAADGWNAHHHWVTEIAAHEESPYAVRKCLLHMNLCEFIGVIDLRERKAAQMRAFAQRARRVLVEFPEWETIPSMTLGDVLGVTE